MNHDPTNKPTRPAGELNDLLEALCEDRITVAQTQRLEQIVLSDRGAMRHYLDYISLHGTLLWDTAKGGERVAEPARAPAAVPTPAAITVAAAAIPSRHAPATSGQPSRRLVKVAAGAAIAAAVACLVTLGLKQLSTNDAPSIAENNRPGVSTTNGNGKSPENDIRTLPATVTSVEDGTNRDRLASAGAGSNDTRQSVPPKNDDVPAIAAIPDVEKPGVREPVNPKVDPVVIDTKPVAASTVAFIDDQIRSGWEASEVQPSPLAEDAEWLRRVHLDLIGRIPSPETVEQFLKDRNPQKRADMVDRLLDDPLYVRHWTTMWTNLLIGRTSTRDEIRTGLQKYLRESFAHNQPWKEVVAELVSAEGTPEENGATGFLLAHLNNEATPATAITSRVFMGVQIQCSQCHCHPFNDRTQNQFWEFNSFFQQTARVDGAQVDPKSGRKVSQVALVNRDVGGPIFYETKGGVMRAAYPRFGGKQIDPGPSVNRRQELSRLMIDESQDQVARAMVNRTWAHFLGAGFTRSVEDMGPHNPPTHPAALERLTDDFVKSGYDLKQLIRWVCATDAYQRTSRFSSGNADDDPVIGNQPLFSRVYVKSMTAEQLYDSLLVATKADDTPRAGRIDLDRQRHDWIQQFVVNFDTDENDETLTFDGTIPQALLMMNSELVGSAVSREKGTYLDKVLRDEAPETDKIRRLCLAALSRQPTNKEMTVLRKMLRDRTARMPRAQNREVVLAEGLQDVFWAFLNSNEFVLVH